MKRFDHDSGRRGFLKGLLSLGAAGALPGSLLVPAKSQAAPFDASAYQVFRNACPRNCYDTCSIKTYVKDGVLQFLEGLGQFLFLPGRKGYN